jgi:PAS domain S-box-containing protein
VAPEPQVIVSEHDPSLAALLEEIFEGEGFSVVRLPAGAEPSDLPDRVTAQLAVVDFAASREDRKATGRIVRELRSRTDGRLPVIGVTADHELLRRASSRFADVTDFGLIGKPFALDELLDVVRAMLRLDVGSAAHLFDDLAVGVLVVDGQQRYTYANPVALDLLGYSLPELLQLRVPDLMTSSPKSTQELWKRYVKERGMTAERFDLRHRDGRLVSVRINSSVLTLGPEEQPLYVAWLRP